jgi:hypothetical protein
MLLVDQNYLHQFLINIFLILHNQEIILESRYDEAKANTNEFITTPLTTASYGIFEDARLKGLI